MEEKVIYKYGSFLDYRKDEHKFVIAAVISNYSENELMLATPYPMVKNIAFPVEEINNDGHIRKSVFIGVAICNPEEDIFDLETGKKLAYRRATSNKLAQHWVASNITEMITDAFVEFLIRQEADYIVEHPEKYILNYTKQRDKYLALKELKEAYKNLSEIDISILSSMYKKLGISLINEVLAVIYKNSKDKKHKDTKK